MIEIISQEIWIGDIDANIKEVKPEHIYSRWVLLIAGISYFIVFITSILIAIFLGPLGYNPYFNAISDLGSSHITPVAFLFDSSCFISPGFIIPSLIIIEKRVAPESFFNGIKNKSVSLKQKFAVFGVAFGLIGLIGLILVGVFSLDRAGPMGIYHGIAAILTFGGFVLCIFIFTLCLICFRGEISKVYAIATSLLPIIMLFLWFYTRILIFEWFSYLSILSYLLFFHFTNFKRGGW